MDKSWKAFERRIAERVGGRRLACTGEKDGVDVDAGQFVFQCKLRRGLPDYLREWIDGITETAKRKGATGIVVWKQPGERVDDAIVILRMADWQELHGSVKNETPDRDQVERF